LNTALNIASTNFEFGIKPEDGFFLVSDIEKYQDKPEIYIVLQKAKKYEVYAVFFRLFVDNRPPIPQIYFYDFTEKQLDEQDFAEKHKKIWNSTQVPLIYVFLKTEVLVFNSYSPDFKDKPVFSVFQKISIAVDVDTKIKEQNSRLLKDFSAPNFANGSFWEKEQYRNDFIVSKNAYEKLITELFNIRKTLLESNEITNEDLESTEKQRIVHRLLIMTILLKYLEEKTDVEGNTVFPKVFFKKYHQNANSFVEVLFNHGEVVLLFDDLSSHFNGEVFKLTEKDKQLLSKINLNKFAYFFEGKTEEDKQRTLWRLYSFDDLPVELISNIYEEFIDDKKKSGIVYTPPFLVNFLLDQLIPITSNDTNYHLKIIDPSCGSGVFLIQAYKRLIYRWKIANNWKTPSLKVLKDILINSIFGVDIKEDAIRLTAFSLTLALCDELSPKVIWENLKFDKLQNNLFADDFFRVLNNRKLKTKFDIVIGNPPFIAELTDDAQIIENKRIDNKFPALPENYSLSFLFLEQVKSILTKENNEKNINAGEVCLLFPADALLLRKNDFNKYFFRNTNIRYITDFVPLRRKLFKTATVGTVAVFYNSKTPTESILHIVLRRTKSSRNEIYFELDKYDFHKVNKEEALLNNFIWKTHYFGVSYRNYELVKKLNELPKLLHFIDNQKKEKNIALRKQNNNPYLIIKLNIQNKLLKNQIIYDDTEIEVDLQSERIKIYSAKNSFETLKEIQNIIERNKEIYRFFILNTSNRAGLSRSPATILPEDIYNIPFEKSSIKLTEIEKRLLDDFILYWSDLLRLGENSIVFNIPNENQQNEFAHYFLKVLNTVYNYKSDKPIAFDSSIIFPFYWGENNIPNDLEELKDRLNNLLHIQFPQANIKFVRIIRLYDKNTIYIIKPNQLRYWLPSVAVRDADETFAYLVNKEYKK